MGGGRQNILYSITDINNAIRSGNKDKLSDIAQWIFQKMITNRELLKRVLEELRDGNPQ